MPRLLTFAAVKRILKFLGLVLLLAVVGLVVVVLSIRESMPEGQAGPEAEALADHMLAAINKPAFDTLSYRAWSYPGDHHYEWFKSRDSVHVRFGPNEVRLNTRTLTGTVLRNNHVISEHNPDVQKYIDRAWSIFCNDSFWLVAPYKVRDEGTERSVADTPEGKALLVHYTSGGITPGDTYLWHLDEQGRPTAWQMWGSNIPVDGLQLSWQGWTQYRNCWLAPRHQGALGMSINLTLNS